MKNDELIDKIITIEERFKEIVKVLEEKELVKDFSYRELYKGVISIQSKITFEPEILFIGINPGCGAFTKKNYKTGKTYYFPKELISENKEEVVNKVQKGGEFGEELIEEVEAVKEKEE